MNAESQTLDCRGLRCPAPILAISRATRSAERPPRLQILADDGDFPTDLRAWCRSTGAQLESLTERDGFFVADVAFTVAEAAPPVSPTAAPSTIPVHDVDCSGMRCPAPILAVAKAAKAASGPAVLKVTATDGDFPTDLEAWCRSTKNNLLSMASGDGTFVALVGLHGQDVIPSGITGIPSAPKAPEAHPVDLDIRAENPGMALLRVGQFAMQSDQFTFAVPLDTKLRHQLVGWAQATGVDLVLREEKGALIGQIRPGVAQTPVLATSPNAAVAPTQAAGPLAVPRENRATLLVLHNDFEPLMAALMVANASAAQGMKVEIYFSFWGVNVLRGPRTTPVTETSLERPNILKRMMKMMMPAGPDKQQLSKMNFGGAGVGMMRHFMKQDNILSLRELMDEAAALDVKFMVCTMSMGLMGISKSDLMDLPNIEFGGVTAFSGAARVSAMSMVF